MKLTLERFCYGPNGVFGVMYIDGIKYYTVEKAWRNNEKSVSCIPEGVYKCVPSVFYRGGYKCYEITEVPNRTRVLIHVANTPNDVEGCIGLGYKLGYVKNSWAVTNSKQAFDNFMTFMNGKEFDLEITHIKNQGIYILSDGLLTAKKIGSSTIKSNHS